MEKNVTSMRKTTIFMKNQVQVTKKHIKRHMNHNEMVTKVYTYLDKNYPIERDVVVFENPIAEINSELSEMFGMKSTPIMHWINARTNESYTIIEKHNSGPISGRIESEMKGLETRQRIVYDVDMVMKMVFGDNPKRYKLVNDEWIEN